MSTAVERFAQAELDPAARRFIDRIPLAAPRAGEQYAFEVDLDACTGCKACVTGCHTQNGLDESELWRTVGLLHGGTEQAPFQQTVTTSCHHCLDPACMRGCPVRAYEKDPVTGIVRHLDDQCIGCQYCLFMCPYDAPKYSPSRGIVRKCDMCADRLAQAQPPACVESCPNGAIRIGLVDHAQSVTAAEASAFLPGAPAPGDTLPTTIYHTARATPRNLLPADFYLVAPERSHPALVVMLVAMQLAIGFDCIAALRGLHTAWTPVLGALALGASLFHLGRPLYAFRAILGLRTSWLSREIVAFGGFVGLAALGVGWASAAMGLCALACSVAVYAATRRPCWRGPITAFKFGMTALVLGLSTAGRAMAWPLVAATAAKLLVEAAGLRHLRDRRHSPAKRGAILLVRDLGSYTAWRFVCGAAGGLVAPALMGSGAPAWLALPGFALCLCGELLERHLFFAAAIAPRMPGAPA